MHCATVMFGSYWWPLSLLAVCVLQLSTTPCVVDSFRMYDIDNLLDAVSKRSEEMEWSPDDSDTDAFSPADQELQPAARNKRYTDYQENAIAICSGDCMYRYRKSYSDCYDVCVWNGRTPSPWVQMDKQLQQQQSIYLLGSGLARQPERNPDSNTQQQLLKHRFGQRKPIVASTDFTARQGPSQKPGFAPLSKSGSAAQQSQLLPGSNDDDAAAESDARKATIAGRRKNGAGKGKAGKAGGRRRKTKTKGKKCIC